MFIAGAGVPEQSAEYSYPVPDITAHYSGVSPEDLMPTILDACGDVKDSIRSNTGWDGFAAHYIEKLGMSEQWAESHQDEQQWQTILHGETSLTVGESLEGLGLYADYNGFQHTAETENGSFCTVSSWAESATPEGRSDWGDPYELGRDYKGAWVDCKGTDGSIYGIHYDDENMIKQRIIEDLD